MHTRPEIVLRKGRAAFQFRQAEAARKGLPLVFKLKKNQPRDDAVLDGPLSRRFPGIYPCPGRPQFNLNLVLGEPVDGKLIFRAGAPRTRLKFPLKVSREPSDCSLLSGVR